jgi:hypothetical protein
MIRFNSPRHERLNFQRHEADPIQFQKHVFETDDEATIEFLRTDFAKEHGVIEVDAPSGASTKQPPAPSGASTIDLDAFPFEKREYKRGNEPFTVALIADNVGAIKDDANAIARAFVETAFPEKSTAQLHILTRARADVGVEDPRIVVNETDLGPALLSTFRNAHVVVRGASQRGDDVEVAAIAAGTPVLSLVDGEGAAATLSAALKATENAYGKASADAAKAAKQLRVSSAK